MIFLQNSEITRKQTAVEKKKKILVFHDFGCQNKLSVLRRLRALTDSVAMLCA